MRVPIVFPLMGPFLLQMAVFCVLLREWDKFVKIIEKSQKNHRPDHCTGQWKYAFAFKLNFFERGDYYEKTAFVFMPPFFIDSVGVTACGVLHAGIFCGRDSYRRL